MFRSGLILGALLIAVSGLIVLIDWDRMSDTMPTQVPPRRLAMYPLAVGLALVALCAAGLAF